MMTAPLVSVIIPAYNAEGTLHRAITSVLLQTYRPWEIIVVDDGSTDETPRVAARDRRYITYERQDHMGAAAARNHGVRLSSGRFLAFLDADDVWHPEKTSYQVNAFARYPGISFASCLGHRCDDDSDLHRVFESVHARATTKIVSDFVKIFRQPAFGTPSIMMPRDVFDRCRGFDESLATAEDIDLWLRAAYGGAVAVVMAKLWGRVVTAGSVTFTIGDRMFPDLLTVIDQFCVKHSDFCERHSTQVRRVKAQIYRNMGAQAFMEGKAEVAREMLTDSLRARVSVDALLLMVKLLMGLSPGRAEE